jgi:hypothetical protein
VATAKTASTSTTGRTAETAPITRPVLGAAARLKLPEIAVDALRSQRRRQAAERAGAGELWQEYELVFTTSVGTGYESHNLRRDFGRVTAAEGLGAR